MMGRTVSLELLPPSGVGPVRIGMSIDEAESALSSLPGFDRLGDPGSMVETRGRAQFASGLTVVAISGPGGLVEAVEVFRPVRPHPVTYRGIDVFATHSNQVVARLAGSTRVEEQDYGVLMVAPDLLLALSRFGPPETDDEDEDGAFFDSVLVAPPGYYDGPGPRG
jgi:hypothetical protein